MTWWQAIILGLVEGITEYLPISSTGHLIITTALLGLDDPSVKRAADTFTIVVQGGAIIAVLGLYRRRVLQMIRGLLGKDQAGRKLFVNLLIAFMPAAILGVLLNDLIETHLFRLTPVLLALALGGVWMIWLDRRNKRRGDVDQWTDIEELSGLQALMIGLIQVVAMWPGTSRSMMTIVGGYIVGLKPARAAEFSFLLGLITLSAAAGYRALTHGP
ncbi:MAG: undecaprenyl-diphosphate phosphatase, partial [Phycisphaerales bacterium JB038]